MQEVGKDMFAPLCCTVFSPQRRTLLYCMQSYYWPKIRCIFTAFCSVPVPTFFWNLDVLSVTLSLSLSHTCVLLRGLLFFLIIIKMKCWRL